MGALNTSILIVTVVVMFIALKTWLKSSTQSNFKLREHEKAPVPNRPGYDMAQQKKNQPLSLPGINLTGTACEILGVPAHASQSEILLAYKEGIKRYHPDRIQNASPEQLKFYEQAAATLNRAKDELLQKLKSSQN